MLVADRAILRRCGPHCGTGCGPRRRPSARLMTTRGFFCPGLRGDGHADHLRPARRRPRRRPGGRRAPGARRPRGSDGPAPGSGPRFSAKAIPRSTTTVAPAAAARALLQRRQHVVHGRRDRARLPSKTSCALGKPVAVQHQPDRPPACSPGGDPANSPRLACGLCRTLPFEVRRRQVVEVDRVVQVEQRALAGGQRLLDRGALRMQPVEIAIQRLVAERGEVRAAGCRPAPCAGSSRAWRAPRRAHQPVQRHHLGQLLRARD